MKDMSKSMKLISSCAYIDTLSFRATSSQMITTSSPSSSSTSSFSSMWDDPIESVIRGLSSERFFFDPKESCSLVLDQHEQSSTRDKKNNPNPNPNQNQNLNLNPEPVGEVVYKESEALCMESNNPCEDFRRSMEEMVEAHGLNDWHGLEQLLGCYLKLNDKVNHSYIMGAFIDLLVNHHHSFVSSTTTTTSTSTSSSNSLSSTNLNCSSPSSPLSLPSSSLTTPCLSSLLDHDDDDEAEEEEVNNRDVNHDDANDGAGDRQC